MPLEINPFTKITLLDSDFVRTINHILESSPDASNGNGVVINFRDPNYSAQNGGFHPVEISIDAQGNILYLTDFAYHGMPPMAELAIELDWNFEQDRFWQFDRVYDLECGRGLLNLYLKNFTAYHKAGCFEVEVSAI
jgi:hypothetical protein